MAKSDLSTELVELLQKHGVKGLPEETTASRIPSAGDFGPRASYIKEIITDSQAFDEKTLSRVANILSRGTAGS